MPITKERYLEALTEAEEFYNTIKTIRSFVETIFSLELETNLDLPPEVHSILDTIFQLCMIPETKFSVPLALLKKQFKFLEQERRRQKARRDERKPIITDI